MTFEQKLLEAQINLRRYLQTTDYTVSQVNGCRVLEVPKHYNFSNPESGSEVYVANIPEFIFEDELFPLFSTIGRIYKLRLMLCFSGATKGFCYVQYINPQLASFAVENLNGLEIRKNRKIMVKKSVNNCRLFFGNIPPEISREEIQREFSYILPEATNIFVYSDFKDPDKNRGFVFVEFPSHRSAALSRRKYSRELKLFGRNISVDWAVPEEQLDDVSQITDLFVRCIPSEITENDIHNYMKLYIPISTPFKVKKKRDFAFIHFNEHNSAASGLKILRDILIKGHKLNITWANPNHMKAKEKEHSRITPNNRNIQSNNKSVSITLFEFQVLLAAIKNAAYECGLEALAYMLAQKTTGVQQTFSMVLRRLKTLNGNSSRNNYITPAHHNNIQSLNGCSNLGNAGLSSVNNNDVPNYSSSSYSRSTSVTSTPFQPLIPSAISAPVDTDNMYNRAKQILKVCNFRLFEALVLFAKRMGWGEVLCKYRSAPKDGNFIHAAKILIKGAPYSVKLACLSMNPLIWETDIGKARDAAAFYIWKNMCPAIQLPIIDQILG